MAETTEMIPTHDDGRMPAFVARPGSGRGPGIVVLQEIFGVTDYMKQRARDLAGLGYVAAVPQLYWRLGPNIQTAENTQEGLQEAFGYMQRLDQGQAVDDGVAALEYLQSLPETAGKAGVVGFCMGGRLAYLVAASGAPDAVVCYYGSGIGNELDKATSISAPILFHFGDSDQFLPNEESARVRDTFAKRSHAEVHIHAGAGHAFDNPSPMFHHAGARAEAWPQTTSFLKRHLE